MQIAGQLFVWLFFDFSSLYYVLKSDVFFIINLQEWQQQRHNDVLSGMKIEDVFCNRNICFSVWSL